MIRRRRLLVILSRRWLGCGSRRLWGSDGAPGLFESREQLLYFTGLFQSIINLHHRSVKIK